MLRTDPIGLLLLKLLQPQSSDAWHVTEARFLFARMWLGFNLLRGLSSAVPVYARRFPGLGRSHASSLREPGLRSSLQRLGTV